ncbi:FAD:protein FMN transferase [Patescibacteria group bacterium]|nr:FAD:protein FMN transferase [Patescibacteria group bacterium]
MRKAITLALIAVIAAGGCILEEGQTTLSEYSETRTMIGTFITVTVYAQDEQTAVNAINASFTAMEALGEELSHYSKTNRVYELNTRGYEHPVELSPGLACVINASAYYSELSGGGFDVTVQPLVALWEQVEKGEPAPTGDEVYETLGRVGYRNLKANATHAWFTRPNMSVTFGAVAKGYIVDEGLAQLRRYSIDYALINAGGDIAAYGGKPSGIGWSIALRNPRNESEYVTLIELRDGAVATSGDYERYYTPDMKIHHIVNPRTGYSATEVISATVIAESATQADALATAVFVLGPEDGIKLVESLPDTEALLITENKTIIKSSGFAF